MLLKFIREAVSSPLGGSPGVHVLLVAIGFAKPAILA